MDLATERWGASVDNSSYTVFEDYYGAGRDPLVAADAFVVAARQIREIPGNLYVVGGACKAGFYTYQDSTSIFFGTAAAVSVLSILFVFVRQWVEERELDRIARHVDEGIVERN
eukprot:11717220-Prorocentrum_lima.AAC.1